MLLGFDQMTAKENGKFFYNTYLSRIFFTLRKDSDLPEEKKKKIRSLAGEDEYLQNPVGFLPLKHHFFQLSLTLLHKLHKYTDKFFKV